MFMEFGSMGTPVQSTSSKPSSEANLHGLLPRRFLALFKTSECKNAQECFREPYNCEFFHSANDRRRNPYGKNCILYAPEMCVDPTCLAYPSCGKAHNLFELEFHPLNYLSYKCSKYYACDRIFCSYYHDKQLERLGTGGFFFRFDLSTFKTHSCHLEYPHDLKTCLFYHTPKDRRRPPLTYQHVLCEDHEFCLLGDSCPQAHNKIQQLYHPSRYKSKFCEKFPNNLSDCEYKDFCSFAHSRSEITIELIHEKEQNAEFMVNEYKTVWCPYTTEHDRKNCVYAHNVQDFRRAPTKYNYDPDPCQSWNKARTLKSLEMGGCSKGMRCNKCHGWKELEYHPLRYGKKTTGQRYNAKNALYDSPNCVKEEIMKKLNEKGQKVNSTQQKIQPVMVNQQITAMIGAPFFKSEYERDFSVTERVVKRDFKGSASDGASNKNKTTKRPESVDSFESKPEANQLFIWNLLGPQDKYLDCFRHKIPAVASKTLKERTRSCDKNHEHNLEITYSRSLTHLFAGTSLLQKLKSLHISEIKLVNLSAQDIGQMTFLDPQQKHCLQERLQKYNSESEHSTVSYSSELTEFFRKHNKLGLLDRMRHKRVREQKLLGLPQIQIHSLSFIEEDDKILLPKLIRDFNDNKEFSDLNSMISMHTKMSNSTDEVDQKAPST